MEGIEDLVAGHELFRGLDPAYVTLIAGCARNVVFAAGARLFREGESASEFLLLRHGRVALEMVSPGRGALTVETLGPGDVVGWSWMVPPYRWHFDAEAVEPTRAVSFDAACIRRKFEDDPAMGYALVTRFVPLIVDRLQATQLRLLDLYGDAGPRP